MIASRGTRSLGRTLVSYSTILLVLLSMQLAMPTAAAVTVTKFVTCKAIDETKSPYEAVDITDIFFSTDKRVYALLVLGNVQPPITVSIVAYRPDGTEQGRASRQFTSGPTISYAVWLDISEISRQTGTWRFEAYVDQAPISTIYFELSPPAPRLALVDASIRPGAGEPVYVGDLVTVTYMLKNIGVVAASTVEVRVVDSPTELVVKTTSAKNLAPGLSDMWEVTVRPEKAGMFQVVVSFFMSGVRQVFRLADGSTKDRFTITLTVSLRPPFLVIERITTQPSASEPFYVGDVGTITYVVKNTGQAVATNVEVKVVSVPPEIEVVQVTAPKNLQPDATDEWQVKIRARKQGSYEAYLTFYVDGKKVIFQAEGKTIEQWKIPVVASENPFMQAFGTLVIIGLVFAVGIVVALLMMRRRHRVAAPPTPAAPSIPAPIVTPAAPADKFCTNCGSRMPLAGSFCPNCGARQP